MKRIFIALTACLAAGWIVAGASAQEYALPPGGPPEACSKFTPKMSLAVGTFDRFRRTTSILAPISRRASGTVRVSLLGGGRITEFNVPVDSARGRIRATRGIDAAQARVATAILTIRYPGDADTRAQSLRLRAALRAAKLSSKRPTINPAGQLDAAGAITRRARGVVRVQLEWVNRSDGSISVFERQATIRNGRWSIRSRIPAGIRSQIADRCSTVQSYVLFTGYQALLMRGEMRAFQVLPAP
ncbi:MAG: hypothetical protein M3376_07595 [Actinomycetota bacterium]|nr:hypothetical protein [Actinomycetota bacterium]